MCCETFRVLEPDSHRSRLSGGLKELWRASLHLLVVYRSKRNLREAHTYSLLVGWMHIINLADIQCDSHSGIPQSQSVALGIANDRPIRRGMITGDLHEQEWKIALAPLLSPIGD